MNTYVLHEQVTQSVLLKMLMLKSLGLIKHYVSYRFKKNQIK